MASERKRLLLVEDDERMIEAFNDSLVPLQVDVLTARSKAEAEEQLGADFDIAVCDLGIPTHQGWLDADPEHGSSVISRLLAERPEVIVVIFSGSGSIRNMRDRFADNGVKFFNKSELPECLRETMRLLEVE